ncbi:MAG: tRNA pseudouridine(55) synthase TruB, partial [Chloroflexi bacterium]|nr:tRNA pseudouridine(55) synthase TruB [Chloroflexota bacterium]
MGRDAIDGLINLNKPKGKTSFQMVSLVRRLSGVRKVGHSGTLDPDATGVLPILIGRPTRLATFLTESTKVYRAEVEFGISTDTYDASGNVVQRGDTSALATERIEAALDSFRGVIEQTPPMYSAIKYQGKPLYHLARAGVEVPRQSRKVTISRLEITDWQSP